MVLKICPACNARYTTMPNTGDFVHDCDIPEANEVARKQDVLITHTQFQEFGGAVTNTKNKAEIMMQSVENRLFGTDADILGLDAENLTIRGNPTSRYRQRSHFTYIKDPEKT